LGNTPKTAPGLPPRSQGYIFKDRAAPVWPALSVEEQGALTFSHNYTCKTYEDPEMIYFEYFYNSNVNIGTIMPGNKQ
jgi:hypothetical protein